MLRFRSERGIALVMALGLLTVLTISGTAVTYYATTNLTGSNTHKARGSAYDLAEAGINDAMAVLYNQLDSDHRRREGRDGEADHDDAAPVDHDPVRERQRLGHLLGHAQHLELGVDDHLDREGDRTGTSYQSRTLKSAVIVRGLNVGADGSSWSRFYATTARAA